MNRIAWIVVGVIAAFFVALTIHSSGSSGGNKQILSVQNQRMAKGDPMAPHTFIEYTDIMCPHCAEFHTTATRGGFDEEYIESGKVHMEMRVTSLLQESNVNSVRGAESAYCAADQDKFYDYYDAIVQKLTDDYFSKDIGTTPYGPRIPKLDDAYYLDVAESAGVDAGKMKSCLVSGEKTASIHAANENAIQELPYGSGVPYFIINTYNGSGFAGDYATVRQMMRAGGVT